jgi:hypothetical protein
MSHINKVRIACCLFAVILVAIVYAADAGIAKPAFDFVRGLPLGDKVSHFVLAGTMSTLANLAFQGRRLNGSRYAPGLPTIILAVIVVAEEISQILRSRGGLLGNRVRRPGSKKNDLNPRRH